MKTREVLKLIQGKKKIYASEELRKMELFARMRDYTHHCRFLSCAALFSQHGVELHTF